MANVLVTGGAGFIGRHLVNALVRRGDRVRVLDVAAPGGSNGIQFHNGSITDEAAVGPALDGVEIVYHLAGIAHLWRKRKSDFDLMNRQGTETVLRTAAKKGVRRVVHCSTESILLPRRRTGGSVNEAASPTLEDMAGPYTRSKFLAERAALQAARQGLDVVVVNPTVPIGDGDRNMTPPAAMFALFLSGGSPFFLDCTLNLVDVRDVAEGIVLAAEGGRSGERYVLGGENIALRDLLRRLERMSGRRMPRRAVPAKVAMVTAIISDLIADRVAGVAPLATRESIILALRSGPFDSTKAKRELGYAPRPVEAALTEVVEAFKRGAPGRGNDLRRECQEIDKECW